MKGCMTISAIDTFLCGHHRCFV